MTEINNNVNNYGRKVEKVAHKKGEQTKSPCQNNEDKTVPEQYVPDTGVFGRSQIKSVKGADITRSVDEAVALSKKNPTVLCSCESFFNKLYKDNLESGMNEADAYMNALLAEEEFFGVAQCHCQH